MSKILCLETATTNCSVALGSDSKVIKLWEENTPSYSHSEQLHVFIKQVMTQSSLSFNDLDAIAVSKGPGSYTGLRIGVSAAKGLCFSLDIPLISVPTLQGMATQMSVDNQEVIISLLDARRMEVYACAFDSKHNPLSETEAKIISEDTFQEYYNFHKIHLIGSGSKKCVDLLKDERFNFYPDYIPSAEQMVKLAHQKFINNDFEDVAYFEPFYLKDFILQKKKP